MKLAPCLVALLLAAPGPRLLAAAAPANVRVEHAWIRWLPAGLPNAGYAVIVNPGDTATQLTGVSTPAFADAMLMRSRLDQDDSSMVAVTHIDVPARGSATLAPGGYHIMLSHATRPIKPGDKVPLTLHFGTGSALQVVFSVLPANASGPSD